LTQRVATEVDELALLGIGQHLVRGVDVLELLLRRGSGFTSGWYSRASFR